MPKQTSKAKLNELRLQEEMHRIRQKTFDAQTQIKEEKKANMRLESEKREKQSEIAALTQALMVQRARHDRDMDALNEECRATTRHVDMRLEYAESRKQELQRLLESYPVIDHENKRLHMRVQELSHTLRRDGHDMRKASDVVKERSFNTQIQLENQFRRTLQELEQQYVPRAIKKVHSEAEDAIRENGPLSEDLATSHFAVSRALSVHTAVCTKLQEVQTEEDVLRAGIRAQEEAVLAAQTSKLREDAAALEAHADVVALQKQIEEMQTDCDSTNKILRKLDHAHARKDRLRKRNAKLKRKAFSLLHEKILQTAEILEQRQRKHECDLIDDTAVSRAMTKSFIATGSLKPHAEIRSDQNTGAQNAGVGAYSIDANAVWQSDYVRRRS